jgi:hypothetical protein
MDLSLIISEIDSQIANLQSAKALLTDYSAPRKVGRPAKATSLVASHSIKKARKPLSAEAKARIAAAQKKRWAKARKAAGASKSASGVAKKTNPAPEKKTAGKKAPPKAVSVKTA